jgi:hypothetical protein
LIIAPFHADPPGTRRLPPSHLNAFARPDDALLARGTIAVVDGFAHDLGGQQGHVMDSGGQGLHLAQHLRKRFGFSAKVHFQPDRDLHHRSTAQSALRHGMRWLCGHHVLIFSGCTSSMRLTEMK